MYVTSAWSKVFALDAATGRELWSYDPKVPGAAAMNACCDVVNRGVAAWEGKLYLGTLDGRLVALDAATGKPVWEVMTVEPGVTLHDHRRAARRQGQSDHRQRRRRDRRARLRHRPTTPRPASRSGASTRCPAIRRKPFENPALEMAAKTWTGEWWKLGGGGTVWDSMAYDPELDLLYIGTGNGSPWNRAIRSPGGGDNLFLSSIVALKPGDRRIRLALPDHARRHLGLHRHPAHDPRRPHDRRPRPQGDHAGAEERLLLRARPRHRRADLGAAPSRPINWATRRRHEDRPARSRTPRRATARPASRSSRSPAPAARTAGSRWLQPAHRAWSTSR